MEFLLLRCNKPFHFCSKDTHITFLLINFYNKRHVNKSIHTHVNDLRSKSHCVGHFSMMSLYSLTHLSTVYMCDNFSATTQPYGFKWGINTGGGGGRGASNERYQNVT